MTSPNKDHGRSAELRRQAESRADEKAALLPEDREVLSPQVTRRMLHGLRVHQIELEMQNEELRRTQVELDAARVRYFDLYDLAPVGYCTVGETGLILEANLTAASLLGLVRRELVKRPISRFILQADQDIYYLHTKLLLESGKPQSCELRMVKSTGAPFWVHLLASNVQDADGVSVHRVILSEISGRKTMEAALQKKNEELESARRIADAANLAKSDFLSGMSHELRSPLNAILGFAQLMELGSPPPTATQKSSIDQILKAGWYLLSLIDEILDLALIESGRLMPSLEPLSLPDLMRDCQAMIEPQAQCSGISIRFVPCDAPCFVNADPTHLKQVLVNLLSNAIKYNRAGGTVEVSCTVNLARRVRISVRDTGRGLSPEKLLQLFQPFNRLGQERGKEQGTGIGLVVSKRLIELMGGEVGVDSIEEVGTDFWIEMNSVTAPEFLSGALELSPPLPELVQPVEALSTLLYVEDNLAHLQLVEQLITRRPDIRLVSARDGLSGVAQARLHLPDVILIDINLPGINGFKVLEILREDPATLHIPVMALSANVMPSDIEKGLKAGFFRYLAKPIKLNDFMVALDLALEFSKA